MCKDNNRTESIGYVKAAEFPNLLEFEIGFGVDTQAQDIRFVLYDLSLKIAGEHHEKLLQVWAFLDFSFF